MALSTFRETRAASGFVEQDAAARDKPKPTTKGREYKAQSAFFLPGLT